MKETFNSYRRKVPLNEYIYLNVHHNLQFTTIKKIGTQYDKYLVLNENTLGNKRCITLVKEGYIESKENDN